MRHVAITALALLSLPSAGNAVPIAKPSPSQKPEAPNKASPAANENTGTKDNKDAATKDPSKDAAAKDAAAQGGNTTPASSDKGKKRPPINFDPKQIFDPQWPFPKTGQARGPEPQPGMSLGNDKDWRVQALQVGAMVGVFAGLVALCKQGACQEVVGDVFGKIETTQTPNPRPDTPVRSGQ